MFAVEISKADGTKETRDCTGPKGKTFVSPKGDADSKNGAHDHDAEAQLWWAANGEAEVAKWQAIGG